MPPPRARDFTQCMYAGPNAANSSTSRSRRSPPDAPEPSPTGYGPVHVTPDRYLPGRGRRRAGVVVRDAVYAARCAGGDDPGVAVDARDRRGGHHRRAHDAWPQEIKRPGSRPPKHMERWPAARDPVEHEKDVIPEGIQRCGARSHVADGVGEA